MFGLFKGKSEIKKNTINKLSVQPFGQDQLERAKSYCGDNMDLQKFLSDFIKNNPTRGEMIEFLEELRKEFETCKNLDRNSLICKSLGIAIPTENELMMAERIRELEDKISASNPLAELVHESQRIRRSMKIIQGYNPHTSNN